MTPCPYAMALLGRQAREQDVRHVGGVFRTLVARNYLGADQICRLIRKAGPLTAHLTIARGLDAHVGFVEFGGAWYRTEGLTDLVEVDHPPGFLVEVVTYNLKPPSEDAPGEGQPAAASGDR